jgi:malto-oligosyltrehalose trehalohydrolase
MLNSAGIPRRTLPFGAELTRAGVHFRLWAPKHETIGLAIAGEERTHSMSAVGDGWHELEVPGCGPGALYQFILPDGLRVPDPASRFQPQDVHGPSEVIDPNAFRWSETGWRGRPWEECVLYELHVGAFTAEGTFRAAAERLDELAELGVTAIELMPIADFPGAWNWGYDGVLPFAPDASYGRSEDLKALVDAAHARGIMVLLDVVYNHFGPDGNYLPSYAPVFTDKHQTPWGAAVNFDAGGSEVVRELVAANALYWITEYRMDGLRLDAVHAIMDDGPSHILEEIAAAVRENAGDRHVHLVLENEENLASRLARTSDGRPLQYTAQWNDDVHHVLHTAATGESAGYYREYAGNTELLGRALAEGFAFQGEMMTYRGLPRGEPSAELPPTAFVAFIQNHDQVGNRAFGDRITNLAPFEAVRAIAAIYLLAPQIPMIFMGEEWAAEQPFPFFCDFGPDLAVAVRQGRRAEFARFPEFQDPEALERIPDPTDRRTFESAKLRWEGAEEGPHAAWREWYRRVLSIRRAEIIPRLAGIRGRAGRYQRLRDGAVRVRWRMGDDTELVLTANLSRSPVAGVERLAGRVLWSEGSLKDERLEPWTVVWSLAHTTNE